MATTSKYRDFICSPESGLDLQRSDDRETREPWNEESLKVGGGRAVNKDRKSCGGRWRKTRRQLKKVFKKNSHQLFQVRW